ncbi:thiamine pyrophosphate-dependent enzyme [Melissospora conviva]|uniref:thiamine pyrophosphate-dependent enzyme n=1 Tax=Melissospora conviva TaxID=3388432 RepID=UPI003C26D41E
MTDGGTVAGLVVERLTAWHVPRVFGRGGAAVAPLVEALRATGGEPAFVPVHQAEAAGFMAVGHARCTGGVGVCLAAQGPDAVHLLNGLYDAKLDGRAVVALIGADGDGAACGARQEMEPTRLFGDACSQFVRVAQHPDEVDALLDRAFRTAVATSSPVCLVLPRAVLTQPAPPAQPAAGVLNPPQGRPPARVLPHESDLNAAAGLLAAGSRTAVLVGQGAHGAEAELLAIVDRLDAGVAASLLGKPVLDERLPFHTGVLGAVGSTAAVELMAGCDTLLLVGAGDPWSDYYPVPGQARVVQIDIDGRRVGDRYPVDVPLVGDARETLRALLSRLGAVPARDWRAEVEASVDRWRAEIAARADAPADPVNPQLVVRELGPRLPRVATLTVDAGSVTYWYARHLLLPSGVTAHLSGGLGAVGCAVPYAIAAKLAAPHRPVLALAGDAAMQLSGLAELITVAQRWPQWPDPRLVVLVLNYRDRAGTGVVDPLSAPADRMPDVPYAGWARLLGLHGIRVDRPELVGSAWDEALAADRPTLIEAVVDARVPHDVPEPPLADLRDVMADGRASRLIQERMLG